MLSCRFPGTVFVVFIVVLWILWILDWTVKKTIMKKKLGLITCCSALFCGCCVRRFTSKGGGK